MHFRTLSYRMQIFLLSILMIMLPTLTLGIFMTNRTLEEVDTNYQDAFDSITAQINVNVDTVLADAEKISTLPLLNDDVYRALVTDYTNKKSDYSKDVTLMKTQVTQANQLNTNVITSIFINKYGFSFDYNFNTYSDFLAAFENIQQWAAAAREQGRRTYVGPIQQPRTNLAYQNILPIVKILWDVSTNRELGVLGIAVNFNAVTDFLETSKLPNSQMVFFDQNNEVYFTSTNGFAEEPKNEKLLAELRELSTQVTAEHPSLSQKINIGTTNYTVSISYNETAGWKIVHFLDDSVAKTASKQNLQNFFVLFLITILMSFVLAYFISHRLSKNINHLVDQVDRCEDGAIQIVSSQDSTSLELSKIVDSYNRLNHRLTDSLRENYTIQLNEKQTRLRMLQAQINPHFLYNTLNLMGSLANIHDVPEIRTVATKMSELLRYNLKSGPVVTLKEEADQVERYMTIQRIRFPGKFRMECALPEELSDRKVPSFILQPIVENAVQHGLDEREEDGYVMINCYVDFKELHILVVDNGVGMNADSLEALRHSLLTEQTAAIGKSIGLLNVHQRIQAYCGKHYGLKVDSTEGRGTMIELTLPLTDHLELNS